MMTYRGVFYIFCTILFTIAPNLSKASCDVYLKAAVRVMDGRDEILPEDIPVIFENLVQSKYRPRQFVAAVRGIIYAIVKYPTHPLSVKYVTELYTLPESEYRDAQFFFGHKQVNKPMAKEDADLIRYAELEVFRANYLTLDRATFHELIRYLIITALSPSEVGPDAPNGYVVQAASELAKIKRLRNRGAWIEGIQQEMLESSVEIVDHNGIIMDYWAYPRFERLRKKMGFKPDQVFRYQLDPKSIPNY